jgi:hypothetical protein
MHRSCVLRAEQIGSRPTEADIAALRQPLNESDMKQ